MRGEHGELIRGGWKSGGNSGHTGTGRQATLTNHAFYQAPMAQIPSENDTNIMSEVGPSVRMGPAEPETAIEHRNDAHGYRDGTRWERFVELARFVCCGVEAAPEDEVAVSPRPSRSMGEAMVTVSPRPTMDREEMDEAVMSGAIPVGDKRRRRKRNKVNRFVRFGGDGWMY